MKNDYSVIIEDLIEWYHKNARVLPWRTNPKPYYVWVSEIMLQQTRVEAVKEYFKRFIKELPEVKELAQAPEEKLLKLWEGLGYYNRVRNMQKAAITIMEEYNGELPADYKKLLSLTGIGSYTAGAIGSIAYGIPVPAVDGNVLRVTKRISGSYDDITKASVKKELEQDLLEIMPKKEPGDFNQALMELGAMVCIPNGKPLCEKCPVSTYCVACKETLYSEIPVKPKKKARRLEEKTVFILEYESKYALHKRAETGLLAKLWELPNVEGSWTIDKLENWLFEKGITQYEMELLGEAKHIFSHIEWHMLGYAIRIQEMLSSMPDSIDEDLVWVTKEEINDTYALPSAFSAFQEKM